MAQQLDTFLMDDPPQKEMLERSRVLKSTIVNENYDVDDAFVPASNENEIHTVDELLKFAEAGKVDVDARVICVGEKPGFKKLNTKEFVEASRRPGTVRFKEGALDSFAYDINTSGGSLVGEDYTPLLGGPFNKQLYAYDYLRMHSASFFAYNHDPMARQIISITRDFTLGRGWRSDSENKLKLALWESFVEANDIYNMMDQLATETSIYGETMIWWLPENATKITYHLGPSQKIPKGLIPRVRLIDPSVIWDICTYPEDITRVLFYQWVAPTQYQTYTGSDQGSRVPSSKFIYQQIPGDQVMHFKINSVSNEKRGRSDLFPILGYLKRLRDSVNYQILGLQKNMAWSIDTSIDGSQTDIDAYVQSQRELGTIPQAGSEFVHSKKVERKYVSNEGGGKGGNNPTFDWCLSMIAAGSGIPISYFGTHLSGGQTRASALIATEPATKKFEKRRLLYEQILQKLSDRLFKHFGLESGEMEFTFPELVSQDRSAKIKDVIAAEMQGYITKERAAAIVAKELDISEFDVEAEMEEITASTTAKGGLVSDPLTGPPEISPDPKAEPSAVTQADRRKLDMNNGF